MDSALEAGARRRALALLATPPPVASKRPLKKSPNPGSVSTVTPDPKRHMSETGSEPKSSSAATPASETACNPRVPEVAPVELFSDDANMNCHTPAAIVVDDTQLEDSPGRVATQPNIVCNITQQRV